MKTITVVTPTYNEEDNVEELYARIKAAFAAMPGYRYEQIFIDNASKDGTVAKIKALCAEDPNVKLIVNVRNFGHIRSPYYGLLQARGDAVICMASDLQDPPELFGEFIRQWEAGYKVVLGVKTASEDTALMSLARRSYYRLVTRMADVELVQNCTGFGLYDQTVLEWLRRLDDPYPYFRGMIAELGFESAKVPYQQPSRKRGLTKNNFYSLYDLAMLGITNHSKVPLRLATMLGFATAGMCLVLAMVYLVLKLLIWYDFTAGQAPTVIGMFFLGSVQLIFVGILGEYIGAIHTQVLKRPLVVEKERINFERVPVSAEPGA